MEWGEVGIWFLIVGVALFLVLVLIRGIIGEIHAKNVCVDKGYETGTREELIKSYPIKCYNICFSEEKGNHQCNVKYFNKSTVKGD